MRYNNLYEALIDDPTGDLSLRIQRDLTHEERKDLVAYCEYKHYKIVNLIENVLKFDKYGQECFEDYFDVLDEEDYIDE